MKPAAASGPPIKCTHVWGMRSTRNGSVLGLLVHRLLLPLLLPVFPTLLLLILLCLESRSHLVSRVVSEVNCPRASPCLRLLVDCPHHNPDRMGGQLCSHAKCRLLPSPLPPRMYQPLPLQWLRPPLPPRLLVSRPRRRPLPLRLPSSSRQLRCRPAQPVRGNLRLLPAVPWNLDKTVRCKPHGQSRLAHRKRLGVHDRSKTHGTMKRRLKATSNGRKATLGQLGLLVDQVPEGS